MSLTALALLISAAVYTGFQWTIRIVVYPQFAKVGAAEFVGYKLAHQRRVTWAVGPLFLALTISTGAVVIRPPAGASGWTIAAAVILVVAVLGVTGLLAVPLHTRLTGAFEAETHRRLLAVDTVRLVAAAADTVVAVVLLSGG